MATKKKSKKQSKTPVTVEPKDNVKVVSKKRATSKKPKKRAASKKSSTSKRSAKKPATSKGPKAFSKKRASKKTKKKSRPKFAAREHVKATGSPKRKKKPFGAKHSKKEPTRPAVSPAPRSPARSGFEPDHRGGPIGPPPPFDPDRTPDQPTPFGLGRERIIQLLETEFQERVAAGDRDYVAFEHPPRPWDRTRSAVSFTTFNIGRILDDDSIDDIVELCLHHREEVENALNMIRPGGNFHYWTTFRVLRHGFLSDKGNGFSPTAFFTRLNNEFTLGQIGHPQVPSQDYERTLRERLSYFISRPILICFGQVGGTEQKRTKQYRAGPPKPPKKKVKKRRVSK